VAPQIPIPRSAWVVDPDLMLRMGAILLGAFSATLLTVVLTKIEFNADFLTFLRWVHQLEGDLIGPLDYGLLRPLMEYLGAQNIINSRLEHWQLVFALMWLLFAALGRAYPFRSIFTRVLYWGWAALCAGIGSSFAGVVPIEEQSMLILICTATTFVLLPLQVSVVISERSGSGMGAALAAFFLPLGATIVLPAVYPASVPILFAGTISPALVTLAASLALSGILALLLGLGEISGGTPSWRRWLQQPLTRIGVDILSTLGAATFFVGLGHVVS
jgi:hypothetical protein